MPQLLPNDLQGRLGCWLYRAGWSKLGGWLFTHSRTWREYVREQYRCDHIVGATDLRRESDPVEAEDMADVFDFCPECGADLSSESGE